jgi:hypothetical protein
MAISRTSGTSTQQNTYTGWTLIRNKFNFSVAVSSTFSGTVTLQRRFGSTGTARDVDTFTTSIQTYGVEPEDDMYYRAGIKTGAYTAGSAAIRISQ